MSVTLIALSRMVTVTVETASHTMSNRNVEFYCKTVMVVVTNATTSEINLKRKLQPKNAELAV